MTRRDLTVGIDVSLTHGLDLVALDAERRVVAAHARLTIADAAALVLDELRPAVVCIDSPAQWSETGSSREAERALRSLGINAFLTPREEGAGPFHGWMRVGFAVYDAIARDYPRYRGGEVAGTAAEYFPHASAVALAGSIGPFKQKHAFRRGVLEANGVPTGRLKGIDQVDAALGALTGRIALDGGSCWVGEAREGALLLPAASLPQRWLRQAVTEASAEPGHAQSRASLTPSRATMGKLVVSEFITLDGVIDSPGELGWAFQFNGGPEGDAFKSDELVAAGAQLLGRITYQGFAKAWPSMNTDDFGRKMNSMPKYVVSTTMTDTDATWENTTVIRDDVTQTVARLKETVSGDILVAGSGQLARSLEQAQLVDEYRLMVYPLILGTGKRLFDDSVPRTALRLVEARPVGPDGIVILTYAPAR